MPRKTSGGFIHPANGDTNLVTVKLFNGDDYRLATLWLHENDYLALTAIAKDEQASRGAILLRFIREGIRRTPGIEGIMREYSKTVVGRDFKRSAKVHDEDLAVTALAWKQRIPRSIIMRRFIADGIAAEKNLEDKIERYVKTVA